MIAATVLASQLFLAGVPGPAASASSCPPAGRTRADLLQLKQSQFVVAAADERNRLATAILACLDDPDPAIRDGVVFDGLSQWLRAKSLTPETVLALEASLHKTLMGAPDAAGFRHPFALLILSEVARVDRIEPVFSDAIRAALVDLAAASLMRIDDYRGFDPREGWRHGVAHASDLALQLALNPRVGADGLKRLMDAVAAQVAPKGTHFYIFGEPARLARPVVSAYRRGLLDAAFWESWFASIADPKPLADWGASFQSVDGLARRHNTLAFLHAVAYTGRSAGDGPGTGLATLADKALAQVTGS
jgi:Protein of unknown function (DUF2785)